MVGLGACKEDLGARSTTPGNPASAVSSAIHGSAAACTDCNIVFIVIDTLRADHLGTYGYERETSPNIDALARESLVFRDMVAQSTWTKPGTASLLTGLYPKNHQANTIRDRLADDRILLSEYLHSAGYETHAFVANGNAGPDHNFDRGYDTYHYFPDDQNRIGEPTRSDRMNAKILPFLRELESDQKFFIYIHYVDPHSPYEPGKRLYSVDNTIPFDVQFFAESRYKDYLPDPEKARELRRQLVAAYDDEIRFNDSSVGEVINLLRERDLLERSVIVLSSDHGEQLLERDQVGHTKRPHEEQIRIPWIIRVPGLGHRVVSQQVSQVDVLPSLLSLVGVPVPPDLDGRDVTGAQVDEHLTFIELDSKHMKCAAVRDRTEKLSKCERRVPPTFEADGSASRWFESWARFEFAGNTLSLAIQSFWEPREIEVFSDGTLIHSSMITTERQVLNLPLESGGKHSIVVKSKSPCRRPVDVGVNYSQQCIAFRIFESPNLDLSAVGVPTNSYFLLEDDAGEERNLYYVQDSAARVDRLEKELEAYLSEGSRFEGNGGKAELSDSQIEILRALGYIE